jgi:hypothetical protein
MKWLYLLAYGAAIAGVVYIFFRLCLRERDPKALPLVVAALAFTVVSGVGAFDLWWRDTHVNRGAFE